MVSRVLTDDHPELNEIARNFVCMKFCETDDKQEYYRASGYFLPQWYWQPILAVCYPDGREIDEHWRNTHTAIPVQRVVEILEKALEIAGHGLDPKLVALNRKRCEEAEDALLVENHDEASRIAGEIQKAVPRGWVHADAGRIQKEAILLEELAARAETVYEAADRSQAHGELSRAWTLILAREYAEAFGLLVKLKAGTGEVAGTATGLAKRVGALLGELLSVHRVSVGRIRNGPEIYHQLRAELRSGLGVEEAALQYHLLLDDGTVWSAAEGHGWFGTGNHHRSSVFLSFRRVLERDRIRDARVEIWLAGERIGACHRPGGKGPDGWWNRKEVHALDHSPPVGGTWYDSTEFPKTELREACIEGNRKVHRAPLPPDPVFDEIVKIYRDLDGMRFRIPAQEAKYRLLRLGSKSLPTIVPLAWRHGGVTTYQLLSVLARIPHEKAAGALIHNLGADDVSLSGPAESLLRWLEGQPHVPLFELKGYLKSENGRLRRRAVKALGIVGKAEGFLPILERLRGAGEGTEDARACVSALKALTCCDFGLIAGRSLAEQEKAVQALADWWKNTGETESRPVRMARALEALGMGRKGEIEKASRDKDAKALAPFLLKALGADVRLAERAALFLIKDLRLREMAPAVLERLAARGTRDEQYGLARNALRDLMDTELLGALVPLVKRERREALFCDFLLTLTGQAGLYPPPRHAQAARRVVEAL